MRSARARWIGAGVALALLVGAIALVASIPGMAERRARERAARLGLTFQAEDSELGWRGLRFHGVTLSRDDREIASVGSVEVELRWLAALRDPRGAITRVNISDVEAQVHVDTLRELRATPSKSQPDGQAAPSTAPRRVPEVQLVRADVSLHDEHGVLARAEVERFAARLDAWEAELALVELGDPEGESVALRELRASGPLRGRTPQLARAVVQSANLVWSSRDENGGDGPARLADRILDVRRSLRRSASESAASRGRDARPAERALWTPNAIVELRSARVVDATEQVHRPVLDKLSVVVAAEGAQSLRARGEGMTSTDGSLKWDLHVAPRDARVEGRVSLRAVPLALFAPVLPKLPFHDLERTRVSADLAITGHGLETADVRGELSITELAFASERLARAPVGPVSFTARGQATWTPARRELSALSGEVTSGTTRLLITGALAWPDDAYRVDLQAELPPSRCSGVLATVPAGLLDDLASIELGGEIKAKLEVHVDSADLDATKLDFSISDRCKFRELPEAMMVKRFAQPFTHRVLEPDGTMFEMQTGPGTPAWTPIELISPFMIQAVVAHEDGRFFSHRGFAESEIGAALARNLKARAFKFGASTITMQLVKNVFLHRDKLLSRKFQEALIVWWLEQQVDKKWILELYLNVIEYGTGVYGIRNAALHYFGTLPIHLTPAQAAFLATILPNPKSYDEQYASGTITESTRRRVASFLQHMRSRNRIDDEALAFGLEELEAFRFYDPDQPPPAPVAMRGSAQAPPFALEAPETFHTFELPEPPTEDGSFGTTY